MRENVHFGKPSGLLDQMASAAGGLVFIDFKTDDPVVRPLNYDFSKKGYALAVVNTGGSHADLTDDYAAIPREMKQVAACFDEECLRRVRPEQITQELPRLRSKVSDRAIMRAIHFFQENKRVVQEAEALYRTICPPSLSPLLPADVPASCICKMCMPARTISLSPWRCA